MRTCSKCSEEKELNEFSIRITSKDGYNRKCKKCVTETKWLWAQKNKDKVKKSRENRKDSIKESKKKWYDANPDYNKNYKRKYNRSKRLMERMNNDNILKCRIKISKSIGYHIKEYVNNGRYYDKALTTIEILGCSIEEFKLYIESKFESWMNWDNYGKYNGEFNYGWDFDHIIPICSANTIDMVYELNHYTNFQPLCSKINRDIKRDKINYKHRMRD
jgi:hypothetical protein